MVLMLPDGTPIRGDIITSAVLRSDLAPVPLTLEAEIRVDDDMATRLAEGESVLMGSDEVMTIVKSTRVTSQVSQGERIMKSIKIIALLEYCRPITFVRGPQKAIIKEDSTLSDIYRAAGATLKSIDGDFVAKRFVCLVGQAPSFGVAKALQEEGGVMRWANGKLSFIRLEDLLRQPAVSVLPSNNSDNVTSGFLERHGIPLFYSTDDSGNCQIGESIKERSIRFVPNQDAGRIRNLSRCLVLRKVMRVSYDASISAGDHFDFVGGDPLVVITAAHAMRFGVDGGTSEQYTRLWLGSVEGG